MLTSLLALLSSPLDALSDDSGADGSNPFN